MYYDFILNNASYRNIYKVKNKIINKSCFKTIIVTKTDCRKLKQMHKPPLNAIM